MLQEKWEKIVKVIAESAKYFELPLPDPQGMFGQCLNFFLKHQKLVVHLGSEIFLIFEEQAMLSKVKVYLVSEHSITDKREWEKSLSQFDDEFLPSYIGGSFQSDRDPYINLNGKESCFDSGGLDGEVESVKEEQEDFASQPLNTEPSPQLKIVNEDHGGFFRKPDDLGDDHGGLFQKAEDTENKSPTIYLCPNCDERLVPDDGQLYCEECEEHRFVCLHCQEVQLEVPADEYGKCEDCGKSFIKIECPKCSQKIWPDEIECPHCHEEFELNECPICDNDLIKGLELDCCPYCGEDIYPCPRCGEHFESDPVDEGNCCNDCEQAYVKIKCPNCEKDIYADEQECPHCKQNLETHECPECGRALVVSDKLDECPICDSTIYICPRCHQYINEDPDENIECPACVKTFLTHTCEHCDEEIYIDLNICPHCEQKIALEECPNCEEEIPSGLDECPHCDASLESTQCPHCSKTHYVN